MNKSIRYAAVIVVLLALGFSTRTMAQNFLVASDFSGLMRKVDPTTGSILGTFSEGFGAQEVDSSKNGLVYANFFDNSYVQVINPITDSAVDLINLPGKSRDITFGPDAKLYIASTGDGNGHGNIGIFRYNPANQQVTQFNTSALNGSPIAIAFGPSNDLWVALDTRFNGTGPHSIIRINGNTGSTMGIFATNGVDIPQSLAFGPNGHLYLANQGDNSIVEYDANGTLLGNLVSDTPNPQGLFFLPSGSLAFSRGGDFGQYDFSTHQVTSFSTGYSGAMGLALVSVPEPTTIAMIVLAIVSGITVALRRRYLQVRSMETTL